MAYAVKFDYFKEKPTKTCVFLHLNTTCLPGENDCRITEICMMAINRDNFKEKIKYDQNGRPEIPRVNDKLVLCVNPGTDITDIATEKSKLTNKHLSQQKPFKECASSIRSFLDHLRKPVCLIANYGSRFDFVVLKKELERNNAFDNFFANTHCADSYDALKVLDPLPTVSKKRKADETTKPDLKRSRSEQNQPRGKPPVSSLKKASSTRVESPTKEQSFGVREYFEEMFRRKPKDTHTAEGFCKALVNIVHNIPGFFEWVDEKKIKLENI